MGSSGAFVCSTDDPASSRSVLPDSSGPGGSRGGSASPHAASRRHPSKALPAATSGRKWFLIMCATDLPSAPPGRPGRKQVYTRVRVHLIERGALRPGQIVWLCRPHSDECYDFVVPARLQVRNVGRREARFGHEGTPPIGTEQTFDVPVQFNPHASI